MRKKIALFLLLIFLVVLFAYRHISGVTKDAIARQDVLDPATVTGASM